MYKPKLDKDIRCPLEYGLDVFGGGWNIFPYRERTFRRPYPAEHLPVVGRLP